MIQEMGKWEVDRIEVGVDESSRRPPDPVDR